MEDKNVDAEIGEIRDIASSAQLAWFSLLGFLAFYILVILTTEDADFLSKTKQTQLPIVNMTMSSEIFYFSAPVVSTVLYIYLHFLCIILWRKAQRTPAGVLEQSLSASLIGTIVLTLKEGAQPRGIDKSQSWIAPTAAILAGLLVWFAHPAVLFVSSRASDASLLLAPLLAPAQELPSPGLLPPWVNIRTVTPACLAVSALIGALSLGNALAIRQPGEGDGKTLGSLELLRQIRSGVVSAAVVLASIVLAGFAGFRMLTHEPYIDVSRAALVQVPAGWASADARREAYRRDWCKENDLPSAVCAVRPGDETARNDLKLRRDKFCRTNLPAEEQSCSAFFAKQDKAFAADLARVRKAELESVAELDLERRELGKMKATGARLVHARLERAILNEADLTSANLEGAVLIQAELKKATGQYTAFDQADLTRANLTDASLPSASLAGAAIVGATLDGATLTNATLEYANLSALEDRNTGEKIRTSLKNATLTNARLQGADLTDAVLDGADLQGADLTDAVLGGTILDGADLSSVEGLDQKQLDLAVGNSATQLPAATPPLRIATCWDNPTPEQKALIEAQKKSMEAKGQLANNSSTPAPERPLGCAEPGTSPVPIYGPLLSGSHQSPQPGAQPSTGTQATSADLGPLVAAIADGNATLKDLVVAVKDLPTTRIIAVDSADQEPGCSPIEARQSPACPSPLRPMTALPPAGELVRLHFDIGSSVVTAPARGLVHDAVSAIAATPDGVVLVAGYADRTGGIAWNQRLADDRAQAVRRILVESGVPASRIEAKGYGESDGPFATEDDVSEPLNRSATIILKEADSGDASAKAAMMRDLSSGAQLASGKSPAGR